MGQETLTVEAPLDSGKTTPHPSNPSQTVSWKNIMKCIYPKAEAPVASFFFNWIDGQIPAICGIPEKQLTETTPTV